MGTARVFVSEGQRFGKYVVVEPQARTPGGRRAALVRCDCGNERVVMIYSLLDGVVKSCGCLQRRPDGFTHSHPLYGTWTQMLRRCEDPRSDSYHRYGGRGIKVCERWHDPWLFVQDIAALGPRPTGATLDREDNDGDYAPPNVQWASRRHQQYNRSVSAATAERRKLVRGLLDAECTSPVKVAELLGIPRHVAADDIEWLREIADRQALEQELAAAKRRIAELEEQLSSLR